MVRKPYERFTVPPDERGQPVVAPAGQDQLLICNDAGAIREGYAALLDAVKSGEIEESRVEKSLQRVATAKNLIEPPFTFDKDRLAELSNEISDLKARLK